MAKRKTKPPEPWTGTIYLTVAVPIRKTDKCANARAARQRAHDMVDVVKFVEITNTVAIVDA